MQQKKTELVPAGGGKVRLSDAELHRAACKAIWEGGHIVFESMPSLIAQIIENKTWKSYGKKSFADYALDATSNGLGVNTNQRLWMLRCAMDVKDEHIREWADVLAKVEEMVKLVPVEERGSVANFTGNSLATLAKNVGHVNQGKITYLPSHAGGNGIDGYLLSLRKTNPDIFRKVVSREMTVSDARRAAGLKSGSAFARARYAVRSMSPKERREFIAWLKDEGYLG